MDDNITKEVLEEFENNFKQETEENSIKDPMIDENPLTHNENDDQTEDLGNKYRKVIEENELLKIQLKSRQKEIDDLRAELDDIHNSISYRLGRRFAETSLGGIIKKILHKYFFR